MSGAHAWGLRGMGWQLGADHCCPPRTKIFIRFPKTLFATEDALEIRRQSLGERGAPPILASGVHSGKWERNYCIQASSPGRLPCPHWAARLVCSRIHTQHVPMLLCSLPRSFFFFLLAVLGLCCNAQASLVAELKLSCPTVCGIFVAQPRIEPAFPALQGEVVTTRPALALSYSPLRIYPPLGIYPPLEAGSATPLTH